MKAEMIKDEYIDLSLKYQYTITRVFKDGHIELKGSPRRYLASCFKITDDNGKKISFGEAYRRYGIEKVKRNLGLT